MGHGHGNTVIPSKTRHKGTVITGGNRGLVHIGLTEKTYLPL